MLGLRAERVDILRGRVDVAENLVEVAGRLYFGSRRQRPGVALSRYRGSCAPPRGAPQILRGRTHRSHLQVARRRTCSISDLASTLLGSRRSLGGRRASTTSRSQAHGRGPLDRRGRGSERDSCSRRTLVSSHRSGPVRTPASRVRASCKRCARTLSPIRRRRLTALSARFDEDRVGRSCNPLAFRERTTRFEPATVALAICQDYRYNTLARTFTILSTRFAVFATPCNPKSVGKILRSGALSQRLTTFTV